MKIYTRISLFFFFNFNAIFWKYLKVIFLALSRCNIPEERFYWNPINVIIISLKAILLRMLGNLDLRKTSLKFYFINASVQRIIEYYFKIIQNGFRYIFYAFQRCKKYKRKKFFLIFFPFFWCNIVGCLFKQKNPIKKLEFLLLLMLNSFSPKGIGLDFFLDRFDTLEIHVYGHQPLYSEILIRNYNSVK